MATITLNVTTTADESDGNSGRGLSLRDAITRANQDSRNKYLIQLKSGQVYQLTLQGNGEHFNQTGDLDIYGSNITLKTVGGSAKATIDANPLSQPDSVFHIRNGAEVTMENVVVKGGHLPASQQSGGGLFINGNSTVTLKRSHLTDNTAGRGAGAYVAEGTLNLLESRVSGNIASAQGGGVLIKAGKLNVANTTFDNNRAVRDTGGGIYAWEEGFEPIDVDIRSSVFSNNQADTGGGISTFEGVNLDVHDTQFIRNTVKGAEGGGAIAVVGENSDLATLTVTGQSLFRDNVGDNTNQGGGAIYGQLAKIDITGARFENNRLTGAGDAAGGAIFARDFSQLAINNSRFIENSVQVTRDGTGDGGAIAAENNTDVDIIGGLFDNNNSSNTGGALRIVDGDHTIREATFRQNRARFLGGAMALSETDSAVISNLLLENNVSSSGGAFSLEAGRTEWKNNNRILNNRATGATGGLAVGDGGGGFIRGGNHRFTQMTASRNTAAKDGGFMSIAGTNNRADVQISNSTLSKNRAEDDGGGLDIYSDTRNFSTLIVTNTTLEQNTAGDSGGGIRAREGGEVALSDVSVTGNKAGDRANPARSIVGQGGGLSSLGGRISGKHVTVSNNQAAFGGGGISAAISNASNNLRGIINLVNSDITGNASLRSSAGGVLAGQGSEVTLTNAQVNHNRAAGEGGGMLGLDSGFGRPAAKVKLFHTTVAGNVANTNKDGFGKSGVFMETGGKPLAYGLESDPAQFEAYNSILANTTSGEGQPVNDYAGAKPVNTSHTLVSQLSSTAGWQGRNNLLNLNPQLTSTGNNLYTPSAQSPVLNRGDKSQLPKDSFDIDGDGNRQETLPLDQAGKPRVTNGQVDMGASEFQGAEQSPLPTNPPTEPPANLPASAPIDLPTGDNVIRGTNCADRWRGTANNAIIHGLGHKDIPFGRAGDAQLIGGSRHNRMFGNRGDDILGGGVGSDHQFGRQGWDILWSGAGVDTLTGGGDQDMFGVTRGEDADWIQDFVVSTDVIGLRGNLSLGQIDITQVGGNTLAMLNPVCANDLIAAADRSFLELITAVYRGS